MFRTLFAAVLLVASSALAASAQDYSGRYFGVFVGAVDASNNHTWSGNPAGDFVDVSGGSVGVSYGNNWTSGKTVYGYDVSAALSNADGFKIGGSTPCITPGEACNNELNGYVNLNGRIGFDSGKGFLGYVTAGPSIGNVFASADTGACGGTPCTRKDTRVGYNVGFGVEGAFVNDWRVRGELSYIDLGDAVMKGSTNNVRAEFQYTTLTIGLVRNF